MAEPTPEERQRRQALKAWERLIDDAADLDEAEPYFGDVELADPDTHRLLAYSDDQERDEHGRWTNEGGAGPRGEARTWEPTRPEDARRLDQLRDESDAAVRAIGAMSLSRVPVSEMQEMTAEQESSVGHLYVADLTKGGTPEMSAAYEWSQRSPAQRFEFYDRNARAGRLPVMTRELPEEVRHLEKVQLTDRATPGTPPDRTLHLDYVRTGDFAKAAAVERTMIVARERGLTPDRSVMERLAQRIWAEWKQDSSGGPALALHAAVAKELGAHTWPGQERKTYPPEAEAVDLLEKIGYRFQGERDRTREEEAMVVLQSYVRAQWETTQYLLARGGQDQMELYRAIMIEHFELFRSPRQPGGRAAQKYQEGDQLHAFVLKQNGASSWTELPDIANDWEGIEGSLMPSGDPERVVLRARVPREAVLSIPVFGLNHYSEREVVVAGLPWRAWDAWYDRAPDLRRQPLAAQAMSWHASRDSPFERTKDDPDELVLDLTQPFLDRRKPQQPKDDEPKKP